MEIDLIRAEKIAKENDYCRRWLGLAYNSRFVVSEGLDWVLKENYYGLYDLLLHIRDYRDFNEDNNPHMERDFWKLRFDTFEIIRKIDYYDLNLEGHSPDPTDIEKTIRVMNIMLASER